MGYLLLATTLFLLFLQPTSIFPVLAAYNPIRYVTIASLLAMLLEGARSPAAFLGTRTNRYLLLFIAAQIVSPMAEWIGAAKESVVIWLLYAIIYYLVVKQCDGVGRVRGLVLAVTLAIGYLSYYSLTTFVSRYQPGLRAGGYGWFENPNDLALMLVCGLPLALLLAETAAGFLGALFWYLFAGMFIFNALFTGSRGGLLGLSVVACGALFWSVRVPPLLKRMLALAVLAAVLGTGISVITSRGDLNGLHGDDSSEDRLVQWQAGVRMTLDHPLLGVGPDQFEAMADQYGGIHGLAPHNTVVQVFSEVGIPGGIFFFMFACHPLYVSLRRLRRPEADGEPTAVYHRFLFVALAGFWVCAFFSNRYKSYILYILVSLLVVVRDYLGARETGPEPLAAPPLEDGVPVGPT